MTKLQKSKLLFWVLLLIALYVGMEMYSPSRYIWGYSVYGIDVSKWQGAIDWKAVQQDKIEFTFIKATQGMNKVDTLFKYNWKEAGKQQIVKGAYHYYEPDKSPKEQAKNFIRQVKLRSGDLPPVLDLEEPIAIPLAEFQANVQVWLDEVEQHYQIRPMIYASPSYYRSYLLEAFSDYPVWLARYRKYPIPRLPKEGEQWLFWQYTNKGRVKGIQGDVDLNVFWGTPKELQKVLK
ncbi:MAG: glycoside hydrolase family 25 protein [Flammeovirgaceae bacterium]